MIKRASVGLELAKYMTQRWMDDELKILEHIADMSEDDSVEYVKWFDQEKLRYNKIKDGIRDMVLKEKDKS